MTKTSMERRTLTVEEGLDMVAAGTTRLILIEGEVKAETHQPVLTACSPKPLKVGVYNASETTVQAVASPSVLLRVGSKHESVTPRLTVVMTDRWLLFTERVSVFTGKRGVFGEIHNSLMPFDGHSLGSSLAQATPERREIIDWFTSGGEKVAPSMMSFARLRTYPRARTAALGAGAVLLGVGLSEPGFRPLEGVGVVGLVGGLALHLNLKTLQRKFGYYRA